MCYYIIPNYTWYHAITYTNIVIFERVWYLHTPRSFSQLIKCSIIPPNPLRWFSRWECEDTCRFTNYWWKNKIVDFIYLPVYKFIKKKELNIVTIITKGWGREMHQKIWLFHITLVEHGRKTILNNFCDSSYMPPINVTN